MSKKNIVLFVILILTVVGSVGYLVFTIASNGIVPTHEIKFVTNGGSVVQNQIVKSGSEVVRPDDPVKEDYYFTTWVMDGKVYDFSTPVTNSITLYAAWQKSDNVYLVDFITNCDVEIKQAVVIKGSLLSEPVGLEKEGYMLDG